MNKGWLRKILLGVLLSEWIFAEVLYYLIATFHIGVHRVKIKSIISRSLDRIFIGKVKVTNGVAKALTMKTHVMPIKDKVPRSLVLVPRRGITAIHSEESGKTNTRIGGE